LRDPWCLGCPPYCAMAPNRRRRRWGDLAMAVDVLDRRSSIRVVAWILALALVVIVGRLCFFTVDSAEYAIVTDFGKPTQVIKAPGLGFKYPYQSVRTFDRRLYVYASPSSEFLTLEKTPVVAAGTVVWRVADPRKFLETVFDRTGAESRLGDILFAELGAAVGRNPLTAFVSMDAADYQADTIVAEIVRRCRDVAQRDYGIEVVDVQLRSFDFPKQNRLRLYARMKSERGRISMQYRSEGEEEGLKVRATAEEEKARILGKAVEASQRRRGEGDGEAARIYGEAASQAPEFYAFLRNMEASRSLVRKGTTMVLPADSPLFGVLFDSNYFNGGTVDGDNGSHAARQRN
jgi:modulator of FtsH protease HflC